MKRYLLGVLLASMAMFIFGAVFWMNPLIPSFYRPVPDPAVTGGQISRLFPEDGTYLVPGTREDREEMKQLHEAGPLATVHIRHQGQPMMAPRTMLVGFLHELVSVGFAATMIGLLRTSLNTYVRRVVFCIALGCLIAWFADLAWPIWFFHPWGAYLVNAVYKVLAWVVAGVVLAAIYRPGTSMAKG